MENQLTLLIGVPGSGKSTSAKQFAALAPGRMIISTDAIRAELFGDEALQGAWLMVWQQIERQFHSAVRQINRGDIPGAIYDATNAVRRQRQEAIALARAAGFTTITGIWLDIPLDTCLQRNRERDRCVPEAVIERMHRHLRASPPTLEEGLDRLIRYSTTIGTGIAIVSVSNNRT